MIKISEVEEALNHMQRVVLHEANEGLDNIQTLDYSTINKNNREKILNIENSLREILRIMSQ